MLYTGDIILFTLNYSNKYPSNSSYLGIVHSYHTKNISNSPYIKCAEISIIKKINKKNESKELNNDAAYIFFFDVDISHFEVKDTIYKYCPNNKKLIKFLDNYNNFLKKIPTTI